MPCTTCGPVYPVASFVFSNSNACNNCDPLDCPSGFFDAACVNYSGPAMPCIDVAPNERLDLILQKINTAVCTVVGVDPFPTYNTFCLVPTNTQQQFVEKISQQFCTLLGNFNTFTGTTFPDAIDEVNATIDDINTPDIDSCVDIGYASDDTLKIALTKLSDYVCGIVTGDLNLSSVDWDLCTVVADPPTTVVEGFDFVVGRLCALQSQIEAGTTLPVFDNTATCLQTPTSTDSLVATIIKIRTRLCNTPTFNPSGYTPGCYTVTGASTLDQVLQQILTVTSAAIRTIPTVFDASQFTVTDVDPMNLCLGKEVTITGGVLTEDRLVAVNIGDASPGTLVEKLTEGVGIILDPLANPGTMTISVDSSAIGDEKVKTSVSDPTAGYLEDKITGSTGVINVTTPTIADQVQVIASVNFTLLVQNILDTINNDETLKEQFCALVANCPTPCAAPTAITVTYIP